MKRIVITGMGCVTPLGCSSSQLFNNILNGKTNFVQYGNPEDYPSKVSLVADDFENTCVRYGLSSERNVTNFILASAYQALEESKIEVGSDTLKKACFYIGSSKNYLFDNDCFIGDNSYPIEEDKYPVDIVTGVTSNLKIEGEALLMPVACSGGNVSMSIGANKIKAGECDVAIVGGVDVFNDLCYSIFTSLDILSKTSCSPFMKHRDGITIGEGAGILVIEEYEHAKARNANILAELTGYSAICDAYHLTTPDPEGAMAAKAMRDAIEKSHISPNDIDCVSPHGTGTGANDLQEYSAMKIVFPDNYSKIPVCAIKSYLGHCMGSASAIEAIVSVKSIEQNVVPAVYNPNNDECDFDININGSGTDKQVNHVLSNSFAFSGNVCSVIISRFK